MKIIAAEKQTEYGLPFVEIRGCEEFETAHIFECGQCFRWNFVGGGSAGNMFFGVAGGKAAAVSTYYENGEKVSNFNALKLIANEEKE